MCCIWLKIGTNNSLKQKNSVLGKIKAEKVVTVSLHHRVYFACCKHCLHFFLQRILFPDCWITCGQTVLSRRFKCYIFRDICSHATSQIDSAAQSSLLAISDWSQGVRATWICQNKPYHRPPTPKHTRTHHAKILRLNYCVILFTDGCQSLSTIALDVESRSICTCTAIYLYADDCASLTAARLSRARCIIRTRWGREDFISSP